MPKVSKYQGYEVSETKDPYPDIRQILRVVGLERWQEEQIYTPATIEEEERGIAALSLEASNAFGRNRQKVRRALQATGSFAFDQFGISKANGIDIGSGATGYMVEDLINPEIEVNRASWVQLEANPGAVQHNKNAHPQSVIFQGSYHRPQDLGLNGIMDTVTGLSSLDATQFVPEAINSIHQMLKPGGHLLHIQDVRPGNAVGTRVLSREGIYPPYTVEGVVGANGRLEKTAHVVSYRDTRSVVELMKADLGYAIENHPGLELLMNEWVVARKKVRNALAHKYYSNIAYNASDGYEEAWSLITVARKKD